MRRAASVLAWAALFVSLNWSRCASAPLHALPIARAEPSEAPRPAPTESEAIAPYVIEPTLLAEFDYRVYPSPAEGNTGFALARLRPGLVLRPFDWLRAVASFEFAEENPSVMDAYVRLRAAAWASFTIGYSKPPLFASFVDEPVYALPFPNWSPVVRGFRVRRDLGADVHFTPRAAPLEAWVRIGNGTGSALGNDNALPAGYAALDLVLGRAWASGREERRTYGLRLGGSALFESSRDRDGISGETPLDFVYYRPNVVSGLRIVGEAHAIAYAGPARLTVEGAMAREDRSRDDDGDPSTPRQALPAMRSYGLTAELAWVVYGRPREVGRPPRGVSSEDGGWRGGAVELSARYDGLWLGRGAPDLRPGGSQGGALALKWWPVDCLAATVSSYLTRYADAPIEEPNTLWSWGVIVRTSVFWGQSGQPERSIASLFRRRQP
jgi:phosphate-selective porin OprO/OprP